MTGKKTDVSIGPYDIGWTLHLLNLKIPLDSHLLFPYNNDNIRPFSTFLGVTGMEAWERELMDCYGELIVAVDRLLLRYSKARRQAGGSLPAELRGELLPWLVQLQEVLGEPALLSMEAALRERMVRLERRRIPPGPGVHQIRNLCQKMAVQMVRLPAVWSSPSVLVGTLRMPSQLEVCLNRGFYHIPACLIPEDRLPVDYVAIYQSRTLFPEDCGIRFYGKVKNCIPVRRWQISEIPKNSNEWYYRLEVESWEQLDCPIGVREIPFTHLFTNLFLLTHSLETPELSLETPGRYCHFQALRRAVDQGNHVILRYPWGTLRLKNGQLQFWHRGRKLASYATEAFLATPYAVFHQLIPLLEQSSIPSQRQRHRLFPRMLHRNPKVRPRRKSKPDQ